MVASLSGLLPLFQPAIQRKPSEAKLCGGQRLVVVARRKTSSMEGRPQELGIGGITGFDKNHRMIGMICAALAHGLRAASAVSITTAWRRWLSGRDRLLQLAHPAPDRFFRNPRAHAPRNAMYTALSIILIYLIRYCGEALALVASLTGGSILMLGPCTFGRIPAPGFSSKRWSLLFETDCFE